jgi:predicted lipid-binding transport protein (Tim44 family)
LLQIAVIAFAAKLVWSWWQRRNGTPALAGMAPSHSGGSVPPTGDAARFQAAGPVGGSATEPLAVGQADFDAFERLLGEIQTAYGREDLDALRSRATPEMVSYFAEELTANASGNRVNRLADVKLIQGDLSEAWRESGAEYATVAMRYSLRDYTEDRTTGRVVEGDRDRPEEVVELWTFRRAPGGNWLLSAIQQS